MGWICKQRELYVLTFLVSSLHRFHMVMLNILLLGKSWLWYHIDNSFDIPRKDAKWSDQLLHRRDGIETITHNKLANIPPKLPVSKGRHYE